jgi:hypothetical protein
MHHTAAILLPGGSMPTRYVRKIVVAALSLFSVLPTKGFCQFITPARETRAGGSVLQFGGIGSISSADLEKVASSASAQLTLVLRPLRFMELYGSFNQGAGLTKVTADSFKVNGLLYPEGGNSSFLGQIEGGPYFPVKVGTLDSRLDITGFASFASRTNRLTRDNNDYEFSGGYFGTGARAILSIYTQENIFRVLGGVGYNRVFISDTDLDQARSGLNLPNLPQSVSGIRPVIGVQINALVVEAQFPTMRASNGADIRGLTGYSSIVRFYVVGKFLSFGSHGSLQERTN